MEKGTRNEVLDYRTQTIITHSWLETVFWILTEYKPEFKKSLLSKRSKRRFEIYKPQVRMASVQ